MVFTFHSPGLTDSDERQNEGSILSEQDPMTLSELQEYEEDGSMVESNSATEMPGSYRSSVSGSAESTSSDPGLSLSEFMQDYDVIGKLGEGSFGIVYKIQHNNTKEVSKLAILFF